MGYIRGPVVGAGSTLQRSGKRLCLDNSKRAIEQPKRLAVARRGLEDEIRLNREGAHLVRVAIPVGHKAEHSHDVGLLAALAAWETFSHDLQADVDIGAL